MKTRDVLRVLEAARLELLRVGEETLAADLVEVMEELAELEAEERRQAEMKF
jgi:hypothetical protein